MPRAPIDEDAFQAIQCFHCESLKFRGERDTLCCSRGSHVLLGKHFDLNELRLYHTHRQVLLTKSREVNQLCCLAALGVDGHGNTRGGVHDLPYGFCIAEGRVFQFNGAAESSSRGHPLLGNAQSFLFASSSEGLPTDAQFPPAVLAAATEMREHMLRHNAFYKEWRDKHGILTSHSFMQFERLRLQFREGNIATAPTGEGDQLQVLFSNRGNPFTRPETVAAVLDRMNRVVARFKCFEKEYDLAAFPLKDLSGQRAWHRRANNLTYPRGDETQQPSQLTLRQYLRALIMQRGHLQQYCPHLLQEIMLDGASRIASMEADGFIRYAKPRGVSQGGGSGSAVGAPLRSNLAAAAAHGATSSNTGQLYKLPLRCRGSPLYRQTNVAKGMALVAHFAQSRVS